MTSLTKSKTESRGAFSLSKFRTVVAGLCWALCVGALWLPGSATADMGFAPGQTAVTLSSLQAGAHADLTTQFSSITDSGGNPTGNFRDIRVSLPPGFWGAPAGFPSCTEFDIAYVGLCPSSAQVGTMTADIVFPGGFTLHWTNIPIYNLKHGPDLAAELGANFIGVNNYLRIKVRPQDYGLDSLSLSVSDLVEVAGVSVTLWGVPADHGAGGPRIPFMTNPSTCDQAMTVDFATDFWQDPGTWFHDTAPVGPFTGCDRLPSLNPRLTASPTGRAADSPAGYGVDLKVPQLQNPDGIATPTVKAIKVQFPTGVTISPAAARGLATCSEEQLAAGTDTPPTCPDASKVGTVSITTPALAQPLDGALYLAQPEAGHLFRLFLVASGPGVTIKLQGEARPDPTTGQVTTTFYDTPPLPFSELNVQLKGGDRALLSNPLSCGTYTTSATLTPYGGGPDETATSDFSVDADGAGGACPASQPFAPTLAAGVMSPVAGTSSPFSFRLSRADGQRELGAISSVHLPAGLIGDVGAVPLCGAADAAAATCPDATRIGDVAVGAGAGAQPLYLPGRVYLTGPYKGAPFGLSIVVDAVTGPYDLGTVNVRAAVRVNPDASLSVETDPLPTILQGVSLRLRDIVLNLNRPGFMLNPTSCSLASITATAVSVDGEQAPLSNRFQLGGCSDLGYKPKLSLALGSRSTSGNVSLHAHLRTRPGDANSRKVVVKLPKLVGLTLKNAQTLCTDAQMQANACPASSIVGRASVDSILHQPLSGPVYFVQGASNGKGGSGLPRLFLPLAAEGVTIPLVAQSSLQGGRIVTTFDNIPDVPFKVFDLYINGGSHGILNMPAKACASKLRATTVLAGQNGKLTGATPVVPSACSKHARKATRRS